MSTNFAGKIKQNRFNLFRVLILLLSSAAVLGGLLLPLASRPGNYQIRLGDVATQDYQAPRSITYESKALTEQRIKSVESSIANVYLPVDPAIARLQIDKLRKSLDYINLVRNDPITEEANKIADLSKMDNIQFTKEFASVLINIPEADWKLIQSESISVLEQIMRASIRDSQVADSKLQISSLISYTFSDENSQIIQTITTRLWSLILYIVKKQPMLPFKRLLARYNQ